MKTTIRLAALTTLLFAALLAHAQPAPWVDPAEDAEHFGSPDDILFWTPEQQVAGYRNMHRLVPGRWVRAGDDPLPLPERPLDLDGVPVKYGDQEMTVAGYLEAGSVAGLVVVKDGAVVYERYRLGNDRDTRWISYSVTKSIVSMLVGAAIQDGYIESVDEIVTDYLPRLKGSAYDRTRLRDLLHMASGVAWDETYDDADSDINRVNWETLPLYDYLRALPAEGTPGETFNYNTAETNLVGNVLRAAIGNNLATYLEQKVWQPFGMADDAFWNLTEDGGGEFGGCCLNATLRDYARIGLFALNNGRLADGTPVLPKDWMAESTTPSRGYKYYGYQWWLPGDGSYRASGIFGQGIYVVPQANVVIALQSARPHADRDADWWLQFAMYAALVKAVGDSGAAP